MGKFRYLIDSRLSAHRNAAICLAHIMVFEGLGKGRYNKKKNSLNIISVE